MRLTNQSPDQLQTVFGGEFVREHHSDATHRYLSLKELSEVNESVTASMFDAVLRALRDSLTLR
jgi:hypothetical protein